MKEAGDTPPSQVPHGTTVGAQWLLARSRRMKAMWLVTITLLLFVAQKIMVSSGQTLHQTPSLPSTY